MWWSDGRALVAGAAVLLAACGFEPLYDPGGAAEASRGRVEVGVIDGAPGFSMRQRLVDRLGVADAPTHVLEVELSFDQEGVAITERDVTSRFDVTGVADWRLAPIDGRGPTLDETFSAVTGYSAPSSATTSAFAVLSARRDAEERLALLLADQVAQRIAVEAVAWSVADAP